MHTYEILASWGPGEAEEPVAGMGRRIHITLEPDEDGYARFDGPDGSGWEGRHVGSHEVPGVEGEIIAELQELQKTERGRRVLADAYRLFRKRQENGSQGGNS